MRVERSEQIGAYCRSISFEFDASDDNEILQAINLFNGWNEEFLEWHKKVFSEEIKDISPKEPIRNGWKENG